MLSVRNCIWFAGAALTLLFACLCNMISRYFAWDIPLGDRPILLFVILIISANIAFGTWFFVTHAKPDKSLSGGVSAPATPVGFWKMASGIFALGIVARLILLPSLPILEDDFYRYMWDGAVTAEGLNPYLHAPDKLAIAPEVARLLENLDVAADPLPTDYRVLAEQGEDVLLRANNPNIATIYPPIAQAGFAVAHMIAPFDIIGLKIITLAAETLTFMLLALALHSIHKNASALALYWWHPLVLKEFANSVHMDVLLMPFLALAVVMIVSRREALAQLAFGLAAAVKIWPLMLMPLIAQRNIRSVILAIGGASLALLLILPQLLALNEAAGLTRFGQDWQRNAFAFPLLEQALFFWSETPGTWMRIAIAGGFGLTIGLIWWRQSLNNVTNNTNISSLNGAPVNAITAIITIMTMFLLLLPTGYPWYTIWMLPFLVIKPRFAAILLTLTSAFYYYDFAVQLMDDPGIITWLPAFLCAAPVWLALLFSWRRSKAIAYG